MINLNVLSMNTLNLNLDLLIKLFTFIFVNILFFPYLIFTSLKNNEIYFKLLSSYLKWNIFIANFKINSYISYHDYSDTHILRNIILKQNNCKTIHYKHTHSENIFDQKKNNFTIMLI